MTTISIPRRRSNLVPRAAAVVAVLLLLLGIATVVHSRSVAKPASTTPVVSQSTVPDLPVKSRIHHGRGVEGQAGADSAEAHRLRARALEIPAVTAPPTTQQLPVLGRHGAD